MRIIHADDLTLLPPIEFLADTHLVAKGLNILYGPSGAFKTFYEVHLALTIAQIAPVLYVAAEGVGGLNSRVAAWCEYHSATRGQLHFITHEINLLDTEAVDRFIQAAKALKGLALVIFDTYARCIPGGDENSAKDTGRAIQSCAKIQRTLNTAVSLVHHTNRAERGERGSGAMRGAADVMIEMGNGDGLIRVDCSKEKDGEPWPTEFYRFVPVSTSGILEFANCVEASSKLTQIQIRILEFLSLEVFTEAGATSRQIADSLNIAIGTIYRVLSELKRNSHILQDTKGDPYRISAVGKAALYQALSQNRPVAKVTDIKEYRG